MAPNKFSTMLHRRTNKITRVLTYAFLEWTLIFLLLLNSLFSYFILKFALYFGLKPPCFLCSRLDHLLDSHRKEKNRNSSFSSYTDIICDQHAAEISKIGYCSHHRKLVESQSVCENCSSPPTSNDSEVSAKADDAEDDALKKCSCCDRVINPITKVSSLDFVIKEREFLGGCFSDQIVQVGSDHSDDQTKFGYQVLGDCAEEDDDKSEDDLILEAEKQPLLDDNNKDNDNNGKSKEFFSFTTRNLCPDMLPQHLEFFIDHDDYRLIPIEFVDDDSIKVVSKGGETNEDVGDEKKNETSENCREFELVFEGDDLLLPRCEVTPTKDLPSIQEEEEEESMIEKLQIYKDEEILEDSESFEWHFEGGELLAAGCEIKNLQIREEKIDNSETLNLVFEGDDFVAGCEIDSIYLPKEEEESLIHKLQKVKNEEDKDEDSEILQPIQEEEKEREFEYSLLEEQEETETSENESIMDEQERDYQATEADNPETAETHSTVSVSDEANATHLKSDESDTEEQNQESADKPLIDESKDDNALHLGSYETETERKRDPIAELLIVVEESPTVCEQESGDIVDNAVSEVSNNCPNDIETSEGTVNAKVGMSHNEAEEERVPDTPTSSESLHRKLLLLERRESATEESLDGMTTISEQGSVGETIEKLKVDLLAERKTLRALYKELEEERNASAISANQTMAMITRLQEEKATMQMEASQYQRMMEEQSEYDQEALQMMNELVVKREKEKQELEKELEVYRKKVMDYEEREKMRILSRRRSRTSSASCSYGEESDGVSIDLNQETKDQEEEGGSPHSQQENGHQDTPADTVLCLQDSLNGFEDERQAILEQLKVLEEKLFTLAEEEEEHFENMKPFEQFYEENGKEFDGDNGYGVDSNGFIHANGQHQQERRMNGSMPKKLLLPLFDAADSLESPNGELLNGHDDGFHITKFELEKKRFAIEEEVDQVHERLQALEADREFLKHCIGSIRKGDKGLDLLQEILQHLRDLKNVELQAVKNMDHCASV